MIVVAVKDYKIKSKQIQKKKNCKICDIRQVYYFYLSTYYLCVKKDQIDWIF